MSYYDPIIEEYVRICEDPFARLHGGIINKIVAQTMSFWLNFTRTM